MFDLALVKEILGSGDFVGKISLLLFINIVFYLFKAVSGCNFAACLAGKKAKIMQKRILKSWIRKNCIEEKWKKFSGLFWRFCSKF